MWSFQGRLLRKQNVDRICQLLWRPRPPSLLSDEQIKVSVSMDIYIVSFHFASVIITLLPFVTESQERSQEICQAV